MKFSAYLINLDHAVDRRALMEDQLQKLGICFTRISAVRGNSINESLPEFDAIGFMLRTGKMSSGGEIGCYLSHIKALEEFIKSDSQHALILEDDAQLPDDFVELVDEAIAHQDRWDLLRLSSSREGAYIPLQKLKHGRQLVINTRILKNTAAYLINREGAMRCLKRLLPMRRPYDIALDRDWALGIRSACIHPFPVQLAGLPSQIQKAPRIPLLRATTRKFFHYMDHLMRRHHRKRRAAES